MIGRIQSGIRNGSIWRKPGRKKKNWDIGNVTLTKKEKYITNMKNQNHKKHQRVLFICKKRNDSYGVSFGLINSCKFICNMLNEHGIKSKVVTVVDNNGIDAVVHNYKPTHVFIEALWVVPDKFKVLLPMYPKVEWYVRIHSKIPFLAHEGVAIEWLRRYQKLSKVYDNLHIAANSLETINGLYKSFNMHVGYYPNVYQPDEYDDTHSCEDFPNHENKIEYIKSHEFIDVGCFGAIRPMKNHLIQALAAISFGNQINRNIRFHVNANRIEQKGDAILKNLHSSFKNTRHQLVEHPWMNHRKFVSLVKTMDLGTQVSYSETFNIVAADFAWNNIPVITSDEINWMSFIYKADPNSINSIISKLYISYYGRLTDLQKLNLNCLKRYNTESTKIWLEALQAI